MGNLCCSAEDDNGKSDNVTVSEYDNSGTNSHFAPAISIVIPNLNRNPNDPSRATVKFVNGEFASISLKYIFVVP
jgi:hypothetical protein